MFTTNQDIRQNVIYPIKTMLRSYAARNDATKKRISLNQWRYRAKVAHVRRMCVSVRVESFAV